MYLTNVLLERVLYCEIIEGTERSFCISSTLDILQSVDDGKRSVVR